MTECMQEAYLYSVCNCCDQGFHKNSTSVHTQQTKLKFKTKCKKVQKFLD